MAINRKHRWNKENAVATLGFWGKGERGHSLDLRLMMSVEKKSWPLLGSEFMSKVAQLCHFRNGSTFTRGSMTGSSPDIK